MSPGSIDAASLEDRAADAHEGDRQRVDGDLEGQDDGTLRIRLDEGRGPTRDAERSASSLARQIGRHEFADQPADRAAREPGASYELGTGEGTVEVELGGDRTQVRPAHRLTPLADRVPVRDHPRFVILSFKCLS